MSDLKAAAASSHFLEANGVRLHYLDYGVDGRRPMLCVHGAAAHAHWFDFVAPGLMPNHHVYSVDLRGHGDSAWAEQDSYSIKTYAEDLNALVEALELHDFVLVGHSMGGMISLVYAATYPGRVEQLVIIDSSMLMPLARIEKMRAFGARPARTYATQEELVARYRLNPPDTHIAAPEVIHHMAMHSGRKDAAGRWRHKADRRVYANSQQIAGVPLWAQVQIPALVIKGQHSTRFGPRVMAEIRARAPQVKRSEVAASNHHITLDNPRGFVEVVQEFLGS
jgi:pimeloyl-ACP methyl ester carboxylesterase